MVRAELSKLKIKDYIFQRTTNKFSRGMSIGRGSQGPGTLYFIKR